MCVHRLAGATRDQGMIEALALLEIERRDRGDQLAARIRSWVIVIATTLMGVAILFTVFDAYLDRVL